LIGPPVVPAAGNRRGTTACGRVIPTEDADEDVFFYTEDVGGPDLEEGQDVDFDVEQAPKGPRATNVVRN